MSAIQSNTVRSLALNQSNTTGVPPVPPEAHQKAKKFQDNPEKTRLIQLSQELKELKKIRLAKVETEAEKLYWTLIGVNGLILNHYHETTGAKVFKTFKQWKEDGYSVKKGEKAFRVWSAPLNGKNATEMLDVKTQEPKTVESNFKFWGMCCLFNEFQVEKSDYDSHENTPASPVETNDTPNNHSQPESNTVALVSETPKGVSNKDHCKLVAKFRAMANGLEKSIQACFADRLTNTPKRLAQFQHARVNGERLLRTQKVAFALADLYEINQVPEILRDVLTKKSIEALMNAKLESVANGYHSYSLDTGKPANTSDKAQALWALLNKRTPQEEQALEIQRKVNAIRFSKIEGYFPTQGEVLDLVLEAANLEEGLKVLEPSAGSGHILDALKERFGIVADAFEVNHSLSEILNAKGYPVQDQDFLSAPATPVYERIVMNPPFERLQDVDHILHAYQFLKPGGRLVSVMSPAAFFRNDKKCDAFRQWIDEMGAEVIDLSEGSFKASGTNANTKLVVINK